MQRLTKLFLLAAGAVALSAHAVPASPVITIQIMGSKTGTAGTFTNSINLTAGSSIFFEVVTQFAAPNVSNTNANGHTTNGTTDSVNALPRFSLTDPGTGVFNTSLENSPWSQGSGASAGTTGSNVSTGYRAIANPGNFVNADSQVILFTGTFTPSASTTSLVGATDLTSSSGSLKLSGTLTAISATTEGSADPLVSYSPLTFTSAPEPASMGILGLVGAAALLARRRRTA